MLRNVVGGSRRTLFTAVLLCSVSLSVLAQNADPNQPWSLVTTRDASSPVARHEASGVVWSGNRLLLLGGRGIRPVDRYDPVDNTWQSLGDPPFEMHHFQPVEWQGRIYIVGGFTCCYPSEPSLSNIHIYDPATDSWSIGPEIPAARRRGSAAAVVHDERIYMLGGNTLGHNGGAVPWFDRFDPATGVWTTLPDAPHARDHFSAVIVGDVLVAAGGRQTAQPDPFSGTVAEVDVYRFDTGVWSTSPFDIPTSRAGAMAVGYGSEVIVIGGERGDSTLALDVVEAMDVPSGQWRSLQALKQARHSGGAGRIGDTLYVVAGSRKKGGGSGNELASQEALSLNPGSPAAGDSDTDGLTNQDEVNLYATDPNDADSDDDGLKDGKEIELGLNPNQADTDADGLTDGEEVNVHLTDPLDTDTDNDGLSDGAEVLLYGSKPRLRDTDADGVDDNVEVDLGLDPVSADTDSDGLSDGAELDLYFTDALSTDTDADGLSDGAEVLTHGSNPRMVDSDSDGVADGDEISAGTDPTLTDTDMDGLSDGEELALGLDPLDADTDDDGIPDGEDTDSTTAGTTTDERKSGALWLLLPLLVGRLVFRRR